MDLDEPEPSGTDGGDGDTTLTIEFDAARIQRTLDQAAETMAVLRTVVPQRRFEQRTKVLMAPLADTSRQLEASLDAYGETWRDCARTLERVVEEAAILPSELEADLQRILEGSAKQFSETVAAHRIELAPMVAAALRARAAEPAVVDPDGVVERMLDAVARPPADGSDTSGRRHLVERLLSAGESMGLPRGFVLRTLIAILVGLTTCFANHRGRLQSEERLRQEMIKQREATIDRVEAVVDEVQSSDAGGEPSSVDHR